MKKKWLAVGIILLFIGASVIPSTGTVMVFDDDTTPPVTICSLDPAEPDGENGWYVGSVTVFLNATDDLSGVNITIYRVDGLPWETYTEPFLLGKQGAGIVIEYYSVDNAGNVEPVQSISIKRDNTRPLMSLSIVFLGGNIFEGYYIAFKITAADQISGMNRVEFYAYGELQETVNGSGPTYQWIFFYHRPGDFRVRGLICDLEITDEYVKFFAIIVRVFKPEGYFPLVYAYAYDNAGNWEIYEVPPPIYPTTITYLFENVKIPNNYTGYIGSFLIYATFNIS